MKLNLKYFGITFLLFVALGCTFERQAHAYVDPGSGLLIFQGISAVVSGALFYFRRRIRTLFGRPEVKNESVIQPSVSSRQS